MSMFSDHSYKNCNFYMSGSSDETFVRQRHKHLTQDGLDFKLERL
jgi:hypothetical protein